MAKLTKEQLKFLDAQSIPLSKVLDVSGMKYREWKPKMKALDFWYCYGCTPCNTAGHQLRSTSNHCIQCRPAVIAYQNRHYAAGQVYVAQSKEQGIVKIGTSKAAEERIPNLSSYLYGGAHDWVMVFVQDCPTAGKVEFEAHRLLSNKSHIGSYFKDGRTTECRELFKCSKSTAIRAVQQAMENVQLGP